MLGKVLRFGLKNLKKGNEKFYRNENNPLTPFTDCVTIYSTGHI